MRRPQRIEFPGTLHHVTSQGGRREDIFVDDADRARRWQRIKVSGFTMTVLAAELGLTPTRVGQPIGSRARSGSLIVEGVDEQGGLVFRPECAGKTGKE